MTDATLAYRQVHRDCPIDSHGICAKVRVAHMDDLVPHRCPVCKDGEYYGRLARRGTKESCPNHVTVEIDEDGNRTQRVELVYLVRVSGPAGRNRWGLTGEDLR